MTTGRRYMFICLFMVMIWVFSSGFTSRNRQAEMNDKANELYDAGELEKALTSYTRALNESWEKTRPLLHMNIGNVFFKQGDYDKALAEYLLSGSLTGDESIKARSFYNSGNAYFQKEQYDKAVEAYIESLKMNPDNEDAKHNLELSLRMIQEQENKQEQQEQENNDNKDNTDTDDKRQEKTDSPDSRQPDNAGEKDQEESQPDMAEAEIERLLDLIEDEDKETQEERIRAAIMKDIPQGRSDVEQDW